MSENASKFIDGQKIVCPHCGKHSVVKLRHRIENFKLVETYPTCALCQKRLSDEQAKPSDENKPSALAALLGISEEDEKQRKKARDNEKKALLDGEHHFCKDCRNYIKHPFLSRCGLHNHGVEPMDDCTDFEPLSHKDDGEKNE